MSWFTWLVENADYNNVGLILGVFGVVFSIYTYKVSKERRVLLFKKREIDVIGGSESALSDRIEIRFDGKQIPRVTKTTFWIWNEGNKTIDGTTVAKSDPLRIEIPDGSRVLETTILSSDTANDVSMVETTNRSVTISFEFLEPKQGFRVALIHTAKTEETQLLGTLKGMKPARDYQKVTRLQTTWTVIVGAFMLAVTMISALLVGALLSYPISEEHHFVRLGMFVVGTFASIGGAVKFIEWYIKRAEMKRIPLYGLGD